MSEHYQQYPTPQTPYDPYQVPQQAAKSRKPRTVLVGVIVGLIAWFGGCTSGLAIGGTDEQPVASPASSSAEPTTAPTSDEPTNEPTAEPTAEASPDGTYTGTCDYALFPNKLLAEVEVDNTGNVGMVVKVRVSWPQYGQDAIKETKQVKVGYGKSKTVRFSRSASTSEISNLQSWQERNGYADGCKYTGKFVDTFGAVHS